MSVVNDVDVDRHHGPGLFETSLEVIRSGQSASGAFVASPTFSQYGYSWLRDGAFIAEGLDLAGQLESSARFHRWVAGLVASSAAGLDRAREVARRGGVPSADDYLHCRYAVDGSVAHTDWPTFQLDGPGIWLWSLAHHLRLGGDMTRHLHHAVLLVSHYLADLWATRCSDAWEEFPEHVHTSTLGAIGAGLAAAESLEPALSAEPAVARAMESIDERLSSGRGAFTKWAGSDEVDASLLWMAAPYQTLAPDEPRFAATLQRIEDELVSDGAGVHRYRSDTYYGGGAWPVLSAALGRVWLHRDAPGDADRAGTALRWIEAHADENGWLPEQVATNAFAPERIEEWRERWGESARPLLWSHAAYLALRSELAARVGESTTVT